MSFGNSQKKKSRRIKCGERESQEMDTPHPNQLTGNSLSRKARTQLEK